MALIGLSSGYCDAVLNKLFRNIDFTHPTAVLLSLHTADPLETGGNEVIGGSYARQGVSFAAPAAGAGTARLVAATGAPNASFTMPACTITHFGLWASSGGFIGGGALDVSRTFLVGDTYNVNSLAISID